MSISEEELEIFSRQLILNDFNEKSFSELQKKVVSIVGLGGIGCPLAQYLIACGIKNINLFDDDVIKTYGRGHVRSSSLEVLGVIQIPRGWTATGTFLDIRDSSGNVITSSPPTYHAWRIYTYQSGGTIPDAVTLYTLGSRGINTENAFSGGETVVGAAGQALFLDINITSTSQFIGGGYVLLNAPS